MSVKFKIFPDSVENSKTRNHKLNFFRTEYEIDFNLYAFEESHPVTYDPDK